MIDVRILLILVFALIGGILAYFLGFPMPFLLGGIIGAAGFVLYYERNDNVLPRMSNWYRIIFVAMIGVMIGSRFTPDLIPLLPLFWISAIAIVPFILIAHAGNYLMMRRIGKYEKLDAYFAALPGGIVDSVSLAEEAGADARVVTAQHFVRILMVVGAVPLLFWAIEGNAVGSIAGETLTDGIYSSIDLIVVLAVSLIGLFAGRIVNLPVAHLTGPLILAILLSVLGFLELSFPIWLPHVCQFMIGASLGSQFSGVSRKLLVRGLGIGILSGSFMLLLAASIAILLEPLVPADFGSLFISFAAGGMAEMSLIALTLNFAPVVVALHHLVRIFLTIWIGNMLWQQIFRSRMS